MPVMHVQYERVQRPQNHHENPTFPGNSSELQLLIGIVGRSPFLQLGALLVQGFLPLLQVAFVFQIGFGFLDGRLHLVDACLRWGQGLDVFDGGKFVESHATIYAAPLICRVRCLSVTSHSVSRSGPLREVISFVSGDGTAHRIPHTTPDHTSHIRHTSPVNSVTKISIKLYKRKK